MVNRMVELAPAPLDAVFHALADPTRRAMLAHLAGAPQTVTALAAPHRMSLAAASKHVKALERAGLVRRKVQGRTHVCRLEAAPLASAHGWLGDYRRFWSQQFDALEAVLSAPPAPTPDEGEPR